ncbi:MULTISPECIES: hypothetical protein [unclassified Romboutsia]|uniref:hypothetical protein n=1 Tax=unclassified Romboutsia TaxID=2626894 RepID=UPI0008225E36|nr:MULTISPECIES: hypothetical protein [unclassified Romboutsia]SCH40845.1 Predicted membrane protein [uncultured Clostridium sp.]
MKNKKIIKCFLIVIYSIYLASSVYFFKENEMQKIITIGLCIIGTIALSIINIKYNKLLDNGIFVNLTFFIFISVLLGTCFKFYNINHYDDFLHLYSGIITCNIAYLIIKYFNNSENINNMNIIFIITFLFMFVMGIASMWEILEFTIDSLFGMHTQIGGLKDTMIDMIDALIGSIISIPYFTLKLKNKNISN